jgi:hypothetical protein
VVQLGVWVLIQFFLQHLLAQQQELLFLLAVEMVLLTILTMRLLVVLVAVVQEILRDFQELLDKVMQVHHLLILCVVQVEAVLELTEQQVLRLV